MILKINKQGKNKMQPEKQLVAVLRTSAHNGILPTVRDIAMSRLSTTQYSQTRFRKAKGAGGSLEIYIQDEGTPVLPENLLTEIVESTDFADKIEIEYIGNSASEEKDEVNGHGNGKIKDYHSEAIIKDLRRRLEEQEQEVLEKLELEERLGQQSSRITALESEVATYEEENSALRSQSDPKRSLDDGVIQFISEYATRLEKFESQTTSEPIKTRHFEKKLESIGLDISTLSEDGVETDLERLYRENNPEDTDNYENKKRALKSAEEKIEGLPTEVQDLMIPGIEEYEREIEAYEASQQDFIETNMKIAGGYFDAARQNEDIAESAEKSGCETFPLYITISEEDSEFNLRTYFPCKSNRSKICNRLASEHIFSNSIQDVLDDETIGNIEELNDPETGILFYSFHLEKPSYDRKKTLELKSNLESELKRGFSQTGLERYGFNLDVLFRESVTGKYEEERRDDVTDVRNAFYVVLNGIREDRDEFNGQISSREFSKLMEDRFPDITPYRIRKERLKMADEGLMSIEGRGRGVSYNFNEYGK
tara:strand:- start:4074 stop:5690 length:1617 start_codon:yes stop_codon:yes gene_type:complete